MNRKDFLATLPKKRVASGALFFDKNNAILMVKPTYKTTWEIVGGVVESNELPMNACIRETKEEIGLSISTLTLLCLEYQVTEYDDFVHVHFQWRCVITRNNRSTAYRRTGNKRISVYTTCRNY